jgi:hypothetical protein
MPLELQLADDQPIQQAYHVGAGADQVAGVGKRLLQRAGPTELFPALEHQHRAAGSSQIGGRRQPVVPAADNDRVPLSRAQLA